MKNVDYHLIKRSRKKGKPVFHVRYLQEDPNSPPGTPDKMVQKSTGQTSEAAAHNTVQKWIADGTIGGKRTALKEYLTNFWDPEKSDYIISRIQRNRTFSALYLTTNQNLIEKRVLPYLEKAGCEELRDITPTILHHWITWLQTEENASPRTVNRARQALFVPLTWAYKNDLIPKHPGLNVEPLEESLNTREIFEREELEKLFAAKWKDPRTLAACRLAFYTGARLGEIRGLRWRNVDIDDRLVHIVENWTDEDGLKAPKKKSKRREIDIPAVVIADIQELRKRNPWGTGDDLFVFFDLRSADKPVGKHVIQSALRKVMKECEITGKSFHSFRHSFASHFRQHLTENEIMSITGHRNQKTLDSYTHKTAEQRKALREAQDNILPFPKAN